MHAMSANDVALANRWKEESIAKIREGKEILNCLKPHPHLQKNNDFIGKMSTLWLMSFKKAIKGADDKK